MYRTVRRPRAQIGLLLSLISLPVLAEPRSEPTELEFLRALSAALSSDTLGAGDLTAPYSPQPRTVTPPSTYAFSIDGAFKLGGYVFKDGYAFLHNDGGVAYNNTALGLDALVSSTPGSPYPINGSNNTALGAATLSLNTTGDRNTAVGSRALYSNTIASRNTALGHQALTLNTAGFQNTAVGADALAINTTGYQNTANGHAALVSNTEGGNNTAIGGKALYSNSTGDQNTAAGYSSLRLTSTGDRNSALGWRAGENNQTGSDNIWIATRGANESNTLRIGSGTGTSFFQQNQAFISGIRNATLNGNEQGVCVDTNDQVGPCSASSKRFKQDIREMGEASSQVLELRPVVFTYQPDFKPEATDEQFGLIAEEVAKIYPALVTTDANGRPFSVRYDLLAPLLLNELQKGQRASAVQRQEIAEQRRLIEAQEGELAELRHLVGELVRLRARVERLEDG